MELRAASLACGSTTRSESPMGPLRLCPVFRSAREEKLVEVFRGKHLKNDTDPILARQMFHLRLDRFQFTLDITKGKDWLGW